MIKPFESNYRATIKDYRTIQGKLSTYVLGSPPRKNTWSESAVAVFGWYLHAPCSLHKIKCV